MKRYSNYSNPTHMKPKQSKGETDYAKMFLYLVAFIIIIRLLIYLFYDQTLVDGYEKYNDSKLQEIQQRLSTAIPEIKNIEISGSNKSFTINKRHIYICAKDEKGQYYDDNMLTYVMLHELAHVLCHEVGHTESYKKIFRQLLERATNAGLYDPNQPPIDNYCNY